MEFLEKDLEDIIFNAPNEELQERGLDIYGKKYRQIRIGNYGVADIVTIWKPPYLPEIPGHEDIVTINIYELKQKTIDADAFIQVVKYAKGIRSWLKHTNRKLYKYNINLKLVGYSLSDRHGFKYLPQIFNNVDLINYSYDYNGITFNDNYDWGLIDEGFDIKVGKDE